MITILWYLRSLQWFCIGRNIEKWTMNVAKLWFLNARFSSIFTIPLTACFLCALLFPSPALLVHTTLCLCLASLFQLCGVWKQKCAKRNPNENTSTMDGWKKKNRSNQTTIQRICCAKFTSHYTIHCFFLYSRVGLLGFSHLTLCSLNFVYAKCSTALFVYNVLLLC